MKELTYWFYIFPHVFIHRTETKGTMLYNTSTGTCVKSDNETLNNWIEEVYLPQNLGVILLSNSSIKKYRKELLDEALKKGMVYLVKTLEHPVKPINFLPILNLQ